MAESERRPEAEAPVALVTGGAVRLGRAIALALAGAGYDLLIHYRSSAESARRLQAEIEALGRRAALYAADLQNADEAASVVPAALDALGRLDVLVNNAAIYLEGALAETTLATWEDQFALNLRAPFQLSQAFAVALPEDREGVIVNITDARIFRPGVDHFAYRLTKSALLTMTENMALALAPRIRVNAVALGAILPPPGEDEAYLETVARERVPLRRPGSADAVAESVLYLVRQEFLTGTVVRIDGGEFLT